MVIKGIDRGQCLAANDFVIMVSFVFNLCDTLCIHDRKVRKVPSTKEDWYMYLQRLSENKSAFACRGVVVNELRNLVLVSVTAY
jgi:predicted house-cleaning NTP pyrophosphatase (Maf/HAM1 superfamily)